jgi:uncharacterized membrane protein
LAREGSIKVQVTEQSKTRTAFRWLLAVFYFFAGVAHLRSPGGFLAITPDWVPWPEAVIAVTGVCEIAGAIALACVPRLRAAAGIGLALYAVCVYPANIKHAVEGIAMNGQQLSWWYHGPRLAFQPVFVWWALWAGGVTDWPFRRRPGSSLT